MILITIMYVQKPHDKLYYNGSIDKFNFPQLSFKNNLYFNVQRRG